MCGIGKNVDAMGRLVVSVILRKSTNQQINHTAVISGELVICFVECSVYVLLYKHSFVFCVYSSSI